MFWSSRPLPVFLLLCVGLAACQREAHAGLITPEVAIDLALPPVSVTTASLEEAVTSLSLQRLVSDFCCWLSGFVPPAPNSQPKATSERRPRWVPSCGLVALPGTRPSSRPDSLRPVVDDVFTPPQVENELLRPPQA